MTRTALNLVIDLAAAALFLAMLATGYVLWFALPPGTNKSLWLAGLSRHEWGIVHAWISLALIGALALHVVLHWTWLVTVVRRRLGLSNPTTRQVAATGATALAVVAGALALVAWSSSAGVREIAQPAELGVCSSEGPAAPAPSQIEFWGEVYPVLEASCTSCHGPVRERGGFRVDRREDYFGGAQPLVVPGKAADSALIAIVTGERAGLPLPDRHRLPPDKVALLRAWIDAGANWPARPSHVR
jgi:hypothetical protein